MRPMPPTSAAQVIKVLTREAASVSSPSLSPSRWRIKLNTGCLATAATRPLISEKTMIPTVEKANTQTSAKPNVEPALAAKTSSLMSTNPPTAVMIPSVSSSGFKLYLDLLQRVGMSPKLGGSGIGRFGEQRPDLRAVSCIRLAQRSRCRLQPVMQPAVHRLYVSEGNPARLGLLVHKRPFGGDG